MEGEGGVGEVGLVRSEMEEAGGEGVVVEEVGVDDGGDECGSER